MAAYRGYFWNIYLFIFVINGVEMLPVSMHGVQMMRINSTQLGGVPFWTYTRDGENRTLTNAQCRVKPTDKGIHIAVKDALEYAKLVEYRFEFKGYAVNPLTVNNSWTYKLDHWARVGSSHGQTILNLAFNYGILSLMTLTFGIEKMTVELEDVPFGCMENLTEEEKFLVILDTAIRDLKDEGDTKVFEGQSSVCHQFIVTRNDMAKFTDRCCYEARDSEYVECLVDIPNKWLNILDVLIFVLSILVVLFGPMMMPDWIYTVSLDVVEYYVKLKEPLYKRLAICRREIAQDIEADHIIDLRNRRDYERCRRIVSELPSELIIPIKISQFDIKVNYRKLLVENKVPVGIVESLSRAIFMCKMRELDAFNDCCEANITGCIKTDKRAPWKAICNLFGRILLVFCVPLPFYIRLAVYYTFENPEIESRQEAAGNLFLPMYFNYRVMQYLTPTHPLYLTMYVIYLLAGLTIAYFSGIEKKTKFQHAIADAFSDMKNLSQLNALGMLVSNCLWPFKRFGVFGLFIGIFLWPLLLPISSVICLIYCLPIIFLSCRIVLHIFSRAENRREKFRPTPQKFTADHVLQRLNSKNTRKSVHEHFLYCTPNCIILMRDIFLAGSAIVTLWAFMMLLSEVCTFLAEIMCFTMMGIIINANTVLKYGSLLFLVILYSYDCYNNVNKKYLKLNKALFSEIKFRLGKDIEQFTQLPASIQEPRGFKAAEASEQAEYESTDDICVKDPYQWTINDLILFIDSEDTPRIPKRLFEDVCQIRVAGSPGPVYRSLLDATKKFLMIIFFLLFVFIVVLSFGESYNISSTNQMLATMAGGFMPFMFRNIFKPSNPEVETNLLSFKSKLEEIIRTFCQSWPTYDFVFDIEEEPKSEEEDEEGEEDEKGEGKDEENSETETCVEAAVKCEHCHGTGSLVPKNENSDLPRYEEAASLYNHVTRHIAFSDHIDGSSRRGSRKNSLEKGKSGKDKKDKGKDKKDKDKDKKDKDKKDKKDKDKNGIDWLSLIMRTKDVHVNELQAKIDSMVLEPAEGQRVDILIYVTESDQDWLYERSSISDYTDAKEDVALEVLTLTQPKSNGSIPLVKTI